MRRSAFERGCVYHLTAHGVDDRDIFPTDLDRSSFIRLASRALRRHEIRCYALCLMSTHYHLLVAPQQANLGDAMRLLNGSYSRGFNERYGRRGALFEASYRDRIIRDEAHLHEAIRYIALNPVPSLVVQPGDWPWSTYGQLIGARPPWAFFDPAPVLALFGTSRAGATTTLRAFVET